jgi:hypothetical protein
LDIKTEIGVEFNVKNMVVLRNAQRPTSWWDFLYHSYELLLDAGKKKDYEENWLL